MGSNKRDVVLLSTRVGCGTVAEKKGACEKGRELEDGECNAEAVVTHQHMLQDT